MKKLAFLLALFLAPLLACAPARAQLSNAQVVSSCGALSWPANAIRNLSQDPSGKMCIGGTISATATFTGFTPTGNATLVTSSTTSRVALPSADTTALLRNTGTVDEWIVFGNGSVVATTGGMLLPAGQAIAFTIPAGATNVAAITASAAGAMAVSTGTGSPQMTGGGGGSGGGGGAITAASGAYAAGAFALGSGVDGWNLTEGTKADTAWVSGSGSMIAVLKTIAGNSGTGTAATGSAVPSTAIYAGANSSGNLVGLIQADTSAKVSISTNTITQVVALSSGKKIYVGSFNLHSAGTTTSKWVYGTGSNCGTGTTDLTDLYDFTASDGMAVGSGLGPVLVVPASNALCISNSAAVHVGGSVAYTQF